MRWRWIGLAIAGSIGYWFFWGPKLHLVKVADEYGEERLGIIVGSDMVVSDDEEEEEEEEGNGDGNEER